MKKTTLLLCIALLICCLLIGCSDAKSDGKSTTAAPETTQTPVPDGFYVLYNGTPIALGMKYADVKEGLGAEAAPAEEILPCDGSDAFKDTMHTYAGMTVTENINGIIKDIEISDIPVSGDEAALMGKIKLGAKQEDVVAAMGEPNNFPLAEDDFALTYRTDNQFINVFLDPDNNKETVSGVMMMLMEP